jgi:signal transduction histidine kinase
VDLLRELARDVAHELRGPVQSILVNLEVLRRRTQQGDSNAALERADLIEQEVRRIHTVSDAFLGLLRPFEPGARPLAAETLIATLDPLMKVYTRSRRLTLDRQPVDTGLFLHVRREPVLLALLHLFVAVCAAGEQGATIRTSCASDAAFVEFRFETTSAAGDETLAALDLALASATAGMDDGGTATRDPVSESRGIVVRLRLPRAASLTPPSPQD